MDNYLVTRQTTSGNGILIMDMDAAIKAMPSVPSPIQETVPDDKAKGLPWSKWGDNNLKPQEMLVDIKKCGILNAIIDGKARFTACNGPIPAIVKTGADGVDVVESIVDDPEINLFRQTNNLYSNCYSSSKDLIGLGQGCIRLGLNKVYDKVVRLRRHDISEVRVQKKDKKGKINFAYFSADWDKVSGEASEFVFKKPLLDPNNLLDDLTEKAGKKQGDIAVTFRNADWGTHYYSSAAWMANLLWVRICQGIPIMKAAMFKNVIRIRYTVKIHPDYWEKAQPGFTSLAPDKKEAVRNKVYDEINQYLTGAENAHKSVFIEMILNVSENKYQGLIEFELLPDRDIDGELLKDSSTANSEIAFSMLFNPNIIGASLPAGPYSGNEGGSSIREALLMQVMLHEPERQPFLNLLNLISVFNKWTDTYKGLKWIIPVTVLTTTDTGGSIKSTLTGGVAPSKKTGE